MAAHTVPLVQVTILTPDLPPGAGQRRHGAICFCGKGVPGWDAGCGACGYVKPRRRKELRISPAEADRVDQMLDASLEGVDDEK